MKKMYECSPDTAYELTAGFMLYFLVPAAVVLKIPSLPLTNALATGWISIGNIWMFGGLLLMIKRNRRFAG